MKRGVMWNRYQCPNCKALIGSYHMKNYPVCLTPNCDTPISDFERKPVKPMLPPYEETPQ